MSSKVKLSDTKTHMHPLCCAIFESLVPPISVWSWSEVASVVSNSLKPHGSSVHRILQARILEWVAIFPFPGDLSNPQIKPASLTLALAGRLFTTFTSLPISVWKLANKFCVIFGAHLSTFLPQASYNSSRFCSRLNNNTHNHFCPWITLCSMFQG